MKIMMIANVLLLLAAISIWCLMDFCLVKSPDYPSTVHDYEWTIALLPLATILANLWLNRKRKPISMILVAFGATILVFALFVGLVITVGMWFHFGIGGRL